MTTPNEELRRLATAAMRAPDSTSRLIDLERACTPSIILALLDQLQSQAERIADLEKQHIERLLRIEAEVDVLVAERDELREKYTDTYWALDDAARENTRLRAQLAAIAATEPVAYRWVWKSKPHDIEGRCYTHTPPNHPELQEIEKLFTHSMPAQDVAELVEAFEYHIEQTRPIERSTIALSKYKGAK